MPKIVSPPDNFTVRVRRVETWLERAETARKSGDRDVAFILYWIAFNAAYARESRSEVRYARPAIEAYFCDLRSVDLKRVIRDSIGNKCRHHIHTLVDIEFLFDPYWDYANELPRNYDWHKDFTNDRDFCRTPFSTTGTVTPRKSFGSCSGTSAPSATNSYMAAHDTAAKTTGTPFSPGCPSSPPSFRSS